VTKTLLRQIPQNARHRNKIVTRYAPTCFLLRQTNFISAHKGLLPVTLVTIGLAGAVRSSLLGSRNVTALFPRGVPVTPGSERREMCRSAAAANSAHHPRIDNTQHDCEDLIRQTQHLASKPSQLISADQPRSGLAARVMHSLSPIRRTMTAGRSSTHQRASNGLCSDNQSTSLLSIGTHIIDMIRLLAISGRISKHWEEHGKIDQLAERRSASMGITGNRPHDGKSREGRPKGIYGRSEATVRKVVAPARARSRGNHRTAGETYEPGEMHVLEARKTPTRTPIPRRSLAAQIIDLWRPFRVSSVQIFAAAFPENSGRPWNAMRWSSGLRGFVFPVRRCPGAAEHKSCSVTLLWLRSGS
jgi:hypothetical protein